MTVDHFRNGFSQVRHAAWVIATVVATLASLPLQSTLAAEDDGIQFFEQKIRPVLVEHCYSCHSQGAKDAKKLQASLFLDSAAGVAAGGESGQLLVKGKSADSLLLKALQYDGMEMPPSGKLPDEVIANFAKWIDMGAPDPRTGDVAIKPKREINLDEGKTWWAFQPLKAVAAPDAQQPIDSFIVKAQNTHGLKPNHPTTKDKLIRRAYFDLIGLPPAPEKVAAFVADTSPQAFEKVIDELLASTAYGERWARHWLDAARFAESGGYEFDGFRPGAYHFRDWVIRALNQDMPYDEFVRMQIAGDLLKPNDFAGAAATGFLVAGPYPGQITAKTVEGIRYDQLDDMMMTIGGAMLGLTLGCARCHEHKYDPIPHQDYYSLAASLARTVHGQRTLDLDGEASENLQQQHQAQLAALIATLNTFAADELPKRFADWRAKELDQQPEATRWQVLEPVSFEADRSFLTVTAGGLLVHDGALTPGAKLRSRGMERTVSNEEQYRLVFRTHQKNLQALRLDAYTDKSLPQRGPGLNNDGSFQLAEIRVTAKPLDPQAQDAAQVLRLKPAFTAFADPDQPLAHTVDENPATAWVVRATAKQDNAAIFEFEAPIAGFANGTELVIEMKFRDAGIGRLRLAVSTQPNPSTWAGDVSTQHTGELRAIVAAFPQEMPEPVKYSLAQWFAPFDAETNKHFRAVRAHVAAFPRPSLSEVYTTVAGGQDVFYLRRGEVANKQGKAEPGFLQVLLRNQEPMQPATTSAPVDPRVAMAQWMTDVDHGSGPLLARVMANRVWKHHFGEGIVGTPNDFGVQGELPTHPELLEYLASELVRGGWKLKPLHRLIMLSATYQQSNDIDTDNQKIDPTNRYLWYRQPLRLDAEIIRDALLDVGANLDRNMFGPSVLDNSARRSIYLRVKRSELLPIMTLFDSPEPTQSIGERNVTTVPTQALAMMNSPFVRTQAEKLFARIKPNAEMSLSAFVDQAYKVTFARSPTDTEMARMLEFIELQRTELGTISPENTDKALIEFCHVLLCLNEFVYID